jgi:adenylyl- and sulfurtransferase ThiI
MEKEIQTIINKLMSDLEAAQDLSAYLAKNNKGLREALSDLVAVQNGPPLIQYEREWNEAMSKALAALEEHK